MRITYIFLILYIWVCWDNILNTVDKYYVGKTLNFETFFQRVWMFLFLRLINSVGNSSNLFLKKFLLFFNYSCMPFLYSSNLDSVLRASATICIESPLYRYGLGASQSWCSDFGGPSVWHSPVYNSLPTSQWLMLWSLALTLWDRRVAGFLLEF